MRREYIRVIDPKGRELVMNRNSNLDLRGLSIRGNSREVFSTREATTPLSASLSASNSEEKATTSLDIIEDRGVWYERMRLAGKTVQAAAGPLAFGWSFWGLAGDCISAEEGEGKEKPHGRAKCIMGSIFAAITAGTYIQYTTELYIEVKDKVIMVAARIGMNWVETAMTYALGPFLTPDRVAGPSPRKRGTAMKRAEDFLTEKLRSEVRYIGMWDGLLTGQERKREVDSYDYPVFGFNIDGQDYHSTHMGTDPANKGYARIRMGTGPEPETEGNTRRLKARQGFFPPPEYNRKFFDRGGLDSLVKTDVDGSASGPELTYDPNDQRDRKWLMDQLNCYFGVEDDDKVTPKLQQHGFWWQMYYDGKPSGGTLAAGVIAPFSADKPSLITWL